MRLATRSWTVVMEEVTMASLTTFLSKVSPSSHEMRSGHHVTDPWYLILELILNLWLGRPPISDSSNRLKGKKIPILSNSAAFKKLLLFFFLFKLFRGRPEAPASLPLANLLSPPSFIREQIVMDFHLPELVAAFNFIRDCFSPKRPATMDLSSQGDPSSYLSPHPPPSQNIEPASHSFHQPQGNNSQQSPETGSLRPLLVKCIAVYHRRPLRVKHELNRASVTEVCSKTYYASSQLDLNRSGINANSVKLIKLFRGRPRVQKTIALVTKWLTGKAAQARASGVHQITEKVTNQATYRHISRPYRATALPSIVAPDNSHLQVPADGGYVNLQSQSQVSTGNVFNQQPPTTNQSEYHGLSNIINNVPHGPTPTGTFLYPTPHDPSTGQAAFLYGRYNVSDIWPAHDASAYSDHQPPCSQTLVGSSYNSLAQSEPPSTFQQAYNQYPQDGSSNLNATQIASQEPAFPPTSLYPTPSNPSTSQVASAYGYRDSQPAAGTSSDQPPYLQGLAGGSYNNLAQSELPSSVASVFQQAYSRYLQGGSFNASLAQSTPQGPAFPPTSLYPTPSNPSTSQVASAYSYRNSQPAASTSNDQFPYLQDPAGSSYNSLAQSEPLTSTFQQAHSQYLQGRSSNSNLTQSAPQGPAFPPTFLYPTPSNPSASQVTSAYGYRDSQPAAGTSYDQPPRLQDPAGGSYNRPIQSEPLSFTLSTSQQCVDEVLHDGSSNVDQNAPKVPTLLPTVLDPSMSQAGSNSIKLAGFEHSQLRRPRAIPFLRISRWHYKNGQEQTDSPETRTLQTDNFYQLSEVPFLSINAPLINVKLEASRLMNMSLIRETLYPTKDKNTELADAALAGAITNHTNVDNAMTLEAWKLRAEGQGTLTRLKGTVKQIHKNCQGKSCARGAMAGAYNLSVQLLLKKTEDIIPSRKLDASALLSTRDFLDTIIQRPNDGGQLQKFRIPFGHSGIFIITEHILVDQGYWRYIPLNSLSDWESPLRNIVALSATICELEIQKCSETGWFKPIDLHADGRKVYVKMTKRMNSLTGTDLKEFAKCYAFGVFYYKHLCCAKATGVVVHTKRRTDFAPELVKEHLLRTSVAALSESRSSNTNLNYFATEIKGHDSISDIVAERQQQLDVISAEILSLQTIRVGIRNLQLELAK
ncbi:hypothetical protein EV702DRAFT_1051631 [Suillus placidus]|uniref:Uncharacterized protein n=1 Tax=Suillus placidus TaxID=48579 RepID=A0A9P6ZFI9_9AGAM|nr:hypothetical protein EV702DRAFT_1051631 [Suillus placidus]